MSSGYFSILVKGFNPCWQSSDTVVLPKIIHMYKNATTDLQLYFDQTTKTFVFTKKINGTTVSLSSNSQTFNRNQTMNFLLEVSSSGMRMRILKNNSSVEKYTNTDITKSEGKYTLYPLVGQDGNNQGNAFVEKFIVFNRNFDDDTQANQILQGQYQGFQYEELVKNGTFYNDTLSNWTVSGNPTVKKNTVTINVGDKLSQDINVFPNNKYRFKATKDIVEGGLVIDSYYRNTLLKSDTLSGATSIDGTVIIPDNANKVKLNVQRVSSFTRGSNAYKSDGTVVSGDAPRLETGKFGQAVMIEEGTTNLILNPKMATTTYWTPSNSSTIDVQSTSPSGSFPFGATNCLKNTLTTANGYITQSMNLSLNTIYTWSVWVYIPSDVTASNAFLSVWYNNSGWQSISTVGITERDTWVRKTVTFTSNGTYANHVVGVGLGETSALIGKSFYACLGQLEQKDHATSFFDGTRNSERLTLPNGVINKEQGTIEFAITPKALFNWNDYFVSGISGYRMQIFSDVSRTIYCDWGVPNNPSTMIGSHDALLQVDKLSYVTIKWDSTTMYLYMDGVLKDSKTRDKSYIPTNLVTLDPNSLYHFIRVSNIARSDAEISSVVASSTLPTFDSGTLYLFDPSQLTQSVKMSNISMKFEM